MQRIICAYIKLFKKDSGFSRETETGCLSGGDIMMEGIIVGLKLKRRTELSDD